MRVGRLSAIGTCLGAPDAKKEGELPVFVVNRVVPQGAGGATLHRRAFCAAIGRSLAALWSRHPGGMFAPAAAGPSGGDMNRIRTRTTRLITSDAGMTTAEYAVGTVAAAGLGGLLFKILTSEAITTLLAQLISRAFSWVFGG